MASRDTIQLLLRRLVAESGGNYTEAAAKLGVKRPYLSQLLSGGRIGTGGKVQSGLMRLYPREMARVDPEEASSTPIPKEPPTGVSQRQPPPIPDPDPVAVTKSAAGKAAEAFLSFYPGYSPKEVSEAIVWGLTFDPEALLEEHHPEWWLGKIKLWMAQRKAKRAATTPSGPKLAK